ncbi:flagellar hook assembly protein FlgD [Magnetospirillum molischianum]|uniref:Basal-body rod modification protein FlgD n=1 Tax=Magnetospirillum molischianum DSM 120 TaxID=1150626 RepID=H8FSE5_MAGML|nr:flagellar hook capping FlgD N-terminal domain-containing protein [Magnetospirillum molischianum]CCG41283.1 Flagellar hook capping protein [Magnetospirillum molischianum DSM 120]
MAVDATAAASTSSTGTANSSTSKSNAGRTSLTTNFNTFLTMLTTQLKHQDPLSPMDSTQFTSQLVQYAGVEQQINTNSNLEKMLTFQQSSQTAQAVNYLGELVEVSGNQLPVQGHSGTFSYTLPQVASSCDIQIKNSAGTVVYKTTGDMTAGRHDLTWNGVDSSGKTQDDGIYTVTVAAKDKNGADITPTITSFGQVTKVTNDVTNGTTLEMGAGTAGAKVTVTVDKILGVNADSTLKSTQLAAAQAQYQASMAQYQALLEAQKAATGSGSTGSGSTGSGSGSTGSGSGSSGSGSTTTP